MSNDSLNDKGQVSSTLWRYCPQCASQSISVTEGKALQCGDCGFLYFHNVAAAAGVLIRCGDQFLFAERAKQPSLGMLDLPGGFVDADESLEQGLCRELHEELGLALKPDALTYLGSMHNRYLYAEVEYCTVDAIFSLTLADKPNLVAKDDISAFQWLTRQQAASVRFAFPAVEQAVARWVLSAK
ncbi:NUDIX domain-containing protein [Corallincola spongiicola]|uniref:NUDIX domain-containing protein n=1 Tax=Corallincola spongiicola TaxID=2520508 RepID=A0ABY1WUG9_9GAMM|nr:NUDIX domain-containing protein [Corallincola spongiicola]TAA48399.1 NUDIX domain-containing protein [Corallincola spongiicola]